MVYKEGSLDATFAALAAPARRAMLARLATGEHTIMDLASRFEMTLPAVSKHVHVLERAGLATIRRDGRARRVRLRAAPLREASAALDRYRAFWSRQLDALDAFLTIADADARHTPIATRRSNAKRRPTRRAK